MKKITKQISEILNTNIKTISNIKRFEKGMSNYTYLFVWNNEKYVYRKIGLDANLFVNYEEEFKSLKVAETIGITSPIIYYDINTGTKIQKYIEGQTIDFANFDIFKDALIKTLKHLHNTKDNSLPNYQLVNRLNKYQSYLEITDIKKDFFEMKTFWLKTYENNFQNNSLVFCHNDLQSINIVLNDNQVSLIDFEYAALNDIYYDFATFEENAFLVFESYYNKKIEEVDKNKIYFYQLFQSLQWYLVATYKEKVGFSKLTNYDFNSLANYFISNAIKIYEKIKGVDFK